MSSTEVCPVCCEGHLAKLEKSVLLQVSARQILVDQRGHVCDLCGTEVATGEDLKFNARSSKLAELQANGRMTGYDIKAFRTKIDVSQEVASRIFGGGPIAFCKYEKHDLAPTDAMDNLLWVANKYPFIVRALADRHQVELSEKAVACMDVILDIKALNGTVISEFAVNASSRKSNVYKMWEHVPVIMESSPLASNEISVNFESAMAA